jgi:hypothetical protein
MWRMRVTEDVECPGQFSGKRSIKSSLPWNLLNNAMIFARNEGGAP